MSLGIAAVLSVMGSHALAAKPARGTREIANVCNSLEDMGKTSREGGPGLSEMDRSPRWAFIHLCKCCAGLARSSQIAILMKRNVLIDTS